jgi:T5SS/PEP-CTERM-associated repeat protein
VKHKQHHLRPCLLLFLLLLGTQPSVAQFSTNYQTNSVNGATVHWTNTYFVGSNTFGNALLIRNGGILTNADAYVGNLVNSVSNFVMVSGAGSVWSNANMYLGYSGGQNSLVVSNAGRVQNSLSAWIGNDASSGGNRLLVTGTNSTFSSSNNSFVGSSGSGNNVIITNGGRMDNPAMTLGDNLGCNSNTVLVTGPGSTWTNNGTLTVGRSGSANTVIINKGAQVYSTYAIVGLFGGSVSNSLVVSDAGSLWDDSAVASDINFGLSGAGNSLIVTNGGQVLGYYAYFGRNSAGNSALVSGPGSSFSVNCYIYTGYQGNNNLFTAANGASIVDKFCYIGYQPGSSGNSVVITGTNTSWQNSYSVFVGYSGVGGSLTVSNGATLSAVNGIALGYLSTSSNNSALVAGGGSAWQCIHDTYVGIDGSANSLTISNGAKIIDDYGLIGADPGSDGNSALVTGSGSLWTNNSDLYVGSSGNGNSLVISNGGWVRNYAGLIGQGTNSSNNRAVVTGAGSVWTNTGALMVGNVGSGNTLTIGNGGLVVDAWGLIGEKDSGSNNTAFVESGGVWRNQNLAVGDLGSHNSLFVNGGSVFATNMAVGNDSLSCDNLVKLNSGEINVTNSTGTALLEVYAGSFVLAGGTLRVDQLIVTNACAQFTHLGGTLICKNLMLNPAADADGDGIPNSWEQAHGMDPLNPFDAAADRDGDKMSDLEEYLAGTNPTNSASSLRILSQIRTNNDMRVSWTAVGGKTYVLQAGTTPTSGFADLSPVIAVPGSGETVTNWLHTGGATNQPGRYYRVRLGP